MNNPMPLRTDKPLPSLMTVKDTAELLFGDTTPAFQKRVIRMLKNGVLRKGYGGKNKGSDIYIKTASIRDVAC